MKIIVNYKSKTKESVISQESTDDEEYYHESNLLSEPKFIKQFGGSIVKNNNIPLECYHGTNKSFSEFRPLSHFGTLKAAESINKLFDKGVIIYSVFLHITNPLMIKDYDNASISLAFDLWHQSLITNEELISLYGEDIISYLKEWHLKENISSKNKDIIFKDKQSFIKNAKPNYFYKEINFYKIPDFSEKDLVELFEDKGYDGFVYVNDTEDKGSISWINFNADQVWIAGKEI